MMRTTLVVLVLAAVVPTERAQAQFGGALSVGGGLGGNAGVWARETRLSPSLHFTSAYAAARASGNFREQAGDFFVDRAAFDALAASPALGAFRLTSDASFGRDAATGRAITTRFAPSVSAKIGRTGAWFGSSYEQGLSPRLGAGSWAVFRSAILSISASTRPTSFNAVRITTGPDSVLNDTLGIWTPIQRVTTDTVSGSRAFRWSQVEARLDWSYRRLALTGTLAASRPDAQGRDSSAASALRWGRINAAFMLSPRMSLIAAIGTLPRSPFPTQRASRFATLGVRFSPLALLRDPLPAAVRPAASSFVVSQLAPGTYRVMLRVPSARTVQLSGDFNGWTPVAMTETSPNVWEVSLALTPGTHRVNVRIDGDRWTAPPGLPSVNDEFNGRVGILVIR